MAEEPTGKCGHGACDCPPEEGSKFCVGTPADCIRFLEMYEALGIEEVFLLCAIGPAEHEEVLHTIRLFGEEVIPHFQKKSARG